MIPIILCAGNEGRAVVYGYVEREPAPGEAVRLHRARQVLYWSAECRGLMGLVARGPKPGTRLTPALELPHTTTVWQQSFLVGPAAAEVFDGWTD